MPAYHSEEVMVHVCNGTDLSYHATMSDPHSDTVDIETTHLGNNIKHDNDSKEKSSKAKRLCKKVFPCGFKTEAKELLKFAWPVVSTQMLSRTIRIMPTAFAGHLGKLQLGGTSMAISIANVAASSIGIGMIAACETAFSQSYGSSNKRQVGVYLQTALYLSTLLCIVSWAFMLNTNSILLALGQNPLIAKYTEDYLFIFMSAIFFLLMYQLLSRYIQSQGMVLPCLFIGLFANGVDVVFQYVLVYTAGGGLRGAAWAQFLTYFTLAASVLSFIYFTKSYKETWGGWSLSSLEEWGSFFKLAMSTVMMISIEWWAFEISMFLMGLLGSVSLGANSIMYQIWMFYASISLGFGSAIAYRVGRCLGAEEPKRAKTVAHVSLVIGLILAVVTALITIICRRQLPQLFSSDKDVINLGASMLPILGLFSLFGATKNVCAGIVRGTGRQMRGAAIITTSYVVIALPIGIPLMFLTKVAAAGFWWGLCIGQLFAATSLVTMVFCFNWDKEVERALIRAKITWKQKNLEVVSNDEDYQKNSTHQKNDTYGTVHEHDDVCLTTERKKKQDSNKSRPNYWRNLILFRLFIVAVCLSILVVGILTRYIFLIPPAVNTTIINVNTTRPPY